MTTFTKTPATIENTKVGDEVYIEGFGFGVVDKIEINFGHVFVHWTSECAGLINSDRRNIKWISKRVD